MDGSAKLPKFILPSIAEQLARGGPISRLSLTVAAWIRVLGGRDEQGAPIPINDPLAGILKDRAREGGGDPRAVLAITPIFGELKRDQRFVDEVQWWLRSLYEEGAVETLRACLEQG